MKTNTNNIAYLVEQVKEKDSQSFVMLYEESYQKIYFFALTTLKNQEIAENALEEIYTKILASINSLRNENHFVPWAYKVAYSICTRIASSRRINLTYDEQRESDDFDELIFDINNEKQRIMAQAVLSLDDSLRSTLILTYYHSLSPKDIALIMSCPEGTVQRRLKAARKQLRDNLEKQKQLHLYTSIPIAIALGCAAGSGLSKEKAESILLNSLKENHFSTDISFTVHGVYKGTTEIQKASYKKFFIGLFGSLLLVLGGVFFSVDPEIWAIYPSTTSYVKGLDLEFTVKSLLPLKTVYLTSDSGKRIELTKAGNRTYRAFVEENGTYTAHATAINGKISEQNIRLSNIDTTSPTITNYTLKDNLLTVELSDNNAGVDFEHIYMEAESRARLEPIRLDDSKAIFEIAEKNYTLYAVDKAGNILESKINIVE